MTVLSWDDVGKRFYETGVNKGVLFIPDAQGAYVNGVAWNGLIAVTEEPVGAAPAPKHADNIKYLNLFSVEEFNAQLEAYTYPDEFAQFDGLGIPTPGVVIGQQSRRGFGLCYRTEIGNDQLGTDYGHKVHLVYGCFASPSLKAHNTITDQPDGIKFTWKISTLPVPVTGYKPSSIITIDSTKVAPATLTALETILYGAPGVDPLMPLPDTIIAMFAGGIISVTPTQPTQTGNVVTIPTVTGVRYYINGVVVAAGARTITANTVVTARTIDGYVFAAGVDNDWFYQFT